MALGFAVFFASVDNLTSSEVHRSPGPLPPACYRERRQNFFEHRPVSPVFDWSTNVETGHE